MPIASSPPPGRPAAPRRDRAFRAKPIAPITPDRHPPPPPPSRGQLLRASLLVAVGLALFGPPKIDLSGKTALPRVTMNLG